MTDTTTTPDATGTPSASGLPATPATAAPATPATDTTAPTGGTSTAAPAAASTTEPAKPATPAAPVVPEKYDLKLPEKSLLDPGVLERTAASAKARGLTNEQAQKEIETVASEVANYHKTVLEQHKTQVSEWEKQTKADKEIGGDAFPINAELSRRVVDKFSTPEFKTMLNESGYGNHPEVVRVFARIGRAIGEDQPGGGNPAGGAPKKSAEDVLYGSPPTT